MSFINKILVVAAALFSSSAMATAGTVVFSPPYSTGPLLTSFSSPASFSTTGSWTWEVFSGDQFDGGLKADSSVAFTMRSIAPTGFNTFDFRTMVVANYTRITFDYNASVVGNGSVYWFTNYDSYNVISGAGTVSGLELSPGDTFGFRLVSYNNGQPVNSAILTVSNLTASIPEPSTSVGLMGITALMIAMFLGDRGRGARRS